ncbi:hypothetical protein ACEWY4_024259 [Coilia grayii]|uniref:XK-related protein n=1 Tax=Coilia grayii TaxID=363190 RepID=A0ABD1J301_9TELE
MEEGFPFFYPASDFLLNIAGFIFFLSDVVLDIWAVVTFYQEQAYVSMGVLIFLLLGSSMLLQAFSWLWYNYSSEEERTSLSEYIYLEKYLKNRPSLGVLHVCQLGVIFRFAAVMEISLHNLTSHTSLKEGIAVYLTHDLCLLRLIETFTESAPQLTLMIAIISIREDVEWVTGLKTLGSFSAIAFSVLTYHRSMRAFVKDKEQLSWPSSFVYFLWNLFFIIPRVAAVALVASTLPVVIAAHFTGLWFILFLWACLQKTDFMEHPVWEWLYRATVALIWYFSWFSVSKGRSRGRSIIYHSIIAVDTALLLVLWWWESGKDVSIFGMPAIGVFISVATLYVLGILGKIVYYRQFHPKHSAIKVPEDDGISPMYMVMRMVQVMDSGMDEVDFSHTLPRRSTSPPLPRPLTAAQKRMQKMAGNFYS